MVCMIPEKTCLLLLALCLYLALVVCCGWLRWLQGWLLCCWLPLLQQLVFCCCCNAGNSRAPVLQVHVLLLGTQHEGLQRGHSSSCRAGGLWWHMRASSL